MAFTGVAALIAAETVTTTLVLAAVAEVGLAMSIVGVVTGNKTLMKVGGVLGLVGGVGGMLAGASGAGGAAAGEVAGDAMAQASGEAMNAYGGAAAAESATQSVVSGMESAAGGAADIGSMLDEATQALSESAGAIPETPDFLKEMGAGPEAFKPEVAPTPDALKPLGVETPKPAESLIGNNPPANSVNGSDVMSDAFTPAGASTPGGFMPPTGSQDYFSRFMKWVKTNKEAVSIGGNILKGIAEQPMNDAKTDYYKQMANESQQRYGHGNEVASYAKPLIGAR